MSIQATMAQIREKMKLPKLRRPHPSMSTALVSKLLARQHKRWFLLVFAEQNYVPSRKENTDPSFN